MKTFEYTPLSLESEADFQPYLDSCCIGDTAFRVLYAWQPMLNCRYVKESEYLLVMERAVSGGDFCILFRRPESNLTEILRELMPLPGDGLKFGFVSEAELPDYEAAANALGLGFSASYEDEYSDYIYRKEDYCSLSGGSKKSLRGDVNAMLRQIPDVRMVPYRPEYASACMEAFARWCTGRKCADCVYGCEREALERFLQTYQEPECFGALALSGDRVLSFLIGEILPGGVLDIHFQKNAVRQRGLTYWLSRELAMQHPDCQWIDLEEDMGLPGIRMDKQRLHPYQKRRKYTVVLQP